MAVSVLVLALIFSNSLHGLIMLCLFTLWQMVLIKGYIAYRLKANSGIVFCLAAAASILPLALSKLLPLQSADWELLFNETVAGFNDELNPFKS